VAQQWLETAGAGFVLPMICEWHERCQNINVDGWFVRAIFLMLIFIHGFEFRLHKRIKSSRFTRENHQWMQQQVLPCMTATVDVPCHLTWWTRTPTHTNAFENETVRVQMNREENRNETETTANENVMDPSKRLFSWKPDATIA
jgi:hypothetical protein